MTTSPPPQPPLAASTPPLSAGERDDPRNDLDERIRAAEQAVVARDLRLRHNVRALGDGLRSRTTIGVVGGTAVAVAGFLAARLLPFGPLSRASRARREARRAVLHPLRFMAAERRHQERMSRVREVRRLPWGKLVMLAWPLVPIAMRSRVSPGIAGLATTFGVPLVQRLLQRRRR